MPIRFVPFEKISKHYKLAGLKLSPAEGSSVHPEEG